MERTLNELRLGERGIICGIQTEGTMRRRLLDLGFVENTEIECFGSNPGGGLHAYGVRGAVIAIRTRDAQTIQVKQYDGSK